MYLEPDLGQNSAGKNLLFLHIIDVNVLPCDGLTEQRTVLGHLFLS